MPFQLMPDQQAIQDQYTAGKAAVLAAPGAGKTTLISRLISHWIEQDHVKGQRILVLTFTENAAREFETRTRPLLDSRESLPTFSTIHSFCNRLLRQLDASYSDRQVASDERRYSILDTILSDKNLWSSDFDYTRLVADSLIPAHRQRPYERMPVDIDALKAQVGLDSEHSELLFELPDILARYDEALAAADLLDYDLMIVATCELLRQNTEVLHQLQRRYTHILEDEAQDSNTRQSELLALICGETGNWLRVGDPNQSIYGFSGADFKELQGFAETQRFFPMAQSNRSSAPVMALANAYQQQFPEAFPSNVLLQAGFKNPEPGWIWIKAYQHLQDEVQAVLQAARSLLEAEQSVGVLCRTNLNCQWFHEQFIKAGLPSTLHHDRADHFFQSDMVNTLRHVLDYLLQPHQYHLYQQVMLMLGVDRHTLRLFIHPEQSVAEQLEALAEGLLYHPTAPDEVYRRLVHINKTLRFLLEHLHYPIDDLLEWIAEKLFEDVEQRTQLRLLHALWLQTQQAPVQQLERFRQWLDRAGSRKIRQVLVPETAKDNLTDKGTLHVMTLHKAKGLEWDGVLMPLFHLGKPFDFPDTEVRILQKCLQTGAPSPAMLDQVKLQEEAESLRLVYVGLTRARRYLSVTRAYEKCRPAGVYQAGDDFIFSALHQVYKQQKSEG